MNRYKFVQPKGEPEKPKDKIIKKKKVVKKKKPKKSRNSSRRMAAMIAAAPEMYDFIAKEQEFVKQRREELNREIDKSLALSDSRYERFMSKIKGRLGIS